MVAASQLARHTSKEKLLVRKKIGLGYRLCTVFKKRLPTGRGAVSKFARTYPIVTRILWLDSPKPQNRHAFTPCIYIHGTPRKAGLKTRSQEKKKLLQSMRPIRIMSLDLTQTLYLGNRDQEVPCDPRSFQGSPFDQSSNRLNAHPHPLCGF